MILYKEAREKMKKKAWLGNIFRNYCYRIFGKGKIVRVDIYECLYECACTWHKIKYCTLIFIFQSDWRGKHHLNDCCLISRRIEVSRPVQSHTALIGKVRYKHYSLVIKCHIILSPILNPASTPCDVYIQC